MNIINKLTLRHLKNNKSRTVLTIVGICISIALITAVLTGVYSYLDYCGRVVAYTGGDYHFSVTAPFEKLEEVLGNDDRVESYGIEYSLDEGKGYRIKNARYKYNSVGSWFVGNENCLKMMITCDYDGELPKNSHEILVEEKYIADNNLAWKIGDTVSIESGDRYVGEDGFRFYISGQYHSDELWDNGTMDSYRITGILHGNYPTNGVGRMLIRGADKNQEGAPHALVRLKKVTPFSISVIKNIVDKFSFAEDDKSQGYWINSYYLQNKLALNENSGDILRLIPMCAAVLLLIIAASVVLIYNSFAMSISERTKYLGMLSSVGATKKQKKKSVLYEALALSAVGIPLGLVIGYVVVAIMFTSIGEKIKATAPTGAFGTVSTVSLDVKMPLFIIAITMLIGVATVLVSSLIPSRRAASVSPIDAIRQKDEIKIKHKIRTPFFIRRIFGYEGELAFKNIKRNGAKARIIVVSIALSLVLFLGCNYFCNMFAVSTGLDDTKPYQLSLCFNMGVDKEILAEFIEFADSNPEIKKYYSTLSDGISKDEYTIPLLDDFLNVNNLNDDYKDLADYDGGVIYRVVEDEVFNDLCKANGIDYKEFYDYEYGYRDFDEETFTYKDIKPTRVLLLNNFNHTADSSKPFNQNVIGTVQGAMDNPENKDNIELWFGEGVQITPEIIKQASKLADQEADRERYIIHGLADYDEDNYIFHLDGANSIVAFYPLTVYENRYEQEEYYDGTVIDMGVETDSHAHTAELLNEFFENNEIEASVCDEESAREASRSTILVIQVLLYGFIILISIITITNIINTVANSINHRKKEFAMLKSVGLAPKGFKRMLRFESLFYAIEGIIFGLPLSTLVCYVINDMMDVTLPFAMDIKMCIVSVCAVFVVISLTMLYSSLKVRRSKIIDELKIDIS